ncbi:MAG: DUF4065 domain-containing protein [Clostridiales bacterium]|nr:DUF4065 domain-containing protein [Clostridiales bacterium]
MNEETNIRLNTAVKTSDSAYHSYVTSAISTDTQHYVALSLEEMSKINFDDFGKYSIFDIANWFLSKSEMTHKKMQKLCYYAQAWCYALKGYRLEDTDYQAWIHGPVSPVLWERFKSFGYDPIRICGSIRFNIAVEDELLLEDVWDTYGENTGNALEALTHRELPWIEARRGYEPDERCTVVISPTTMASYYKSIYVGE